MKEIYLKTPGFAELKYRKELLADPETMSYNNIYGGTIDFDESKWEAWYNKWIGNNNSNFFYAYIYSNDYDIPVGEVAYRLDEETNCAMLNIIIDAKRRGNGYGNSALIELVKVAFKNGYKELRDLVFKDSTSSHALFEKLGFKCVGEVDDSKDYRLKEENFIEG